MDFHVLDLITWLVMCVLLHIFAPKEHKEEAGILVYIFVVIIFTVIWVILFAFCGYNVADLFGFISINIKW